MLLRARGERPSDCRAAQQADEFPPPHNVQFPTRAVGEFVQWKLAYLLEASPLADGRLLALNVVKKITDLGCWACYRSFRAPGLIAQLVRSNDHHHQKAGILTRSGHS